MSLVNFEVKSGNLSPELLLKALEQVIPSQIISQAITNTSSLQRRRRILPTHVVIALVIAMSFWSRDSIVDVFKNLIQGISGQLYTLLNV
jgi:Insertion element 4 transposase N-terminal